jgi:hypothetical protein
VVDRSDVLGFLGPTVSSAIGRPGTLNLRAVLVAGLLNAMARHHKGHVSEPGRALNALTNDQRDRLDVTSHTQVRPTTVSIASSTSSAGPSRPAKPQVAFA